MQHDYTKMLSSQLARCLTINRYCPTLKSLYRPRYKMCKTLEKCKIDCTPSCNKSGIEKLDVEEVYCPGGCNDIKSECLHIYGRQCDYILKPSTPEEMENFLRQIEEVHEWAEKERNRPGSTMGPC